MVGGKSLMGLGTYFGPGPPPNTDCTISPFTLIATDLDRRRWRRAMTREELAPRCKDHVKGSAADRPLQASLTLSRRVVRRRLVLAVLARDQS